MGMRKDFIISEEEKERKRKCLEENRNMTLRRLSLTSESKSSLSSSNSLPNSESLSPVIDEIDHVSFYFSTITSNFEELEMEKIRMRIIILDCYQSFEI
jgi:hypothetical protein